MSETPPLLGSGQYDRYRRHLSLPLFGVEGQRRLLAGRVLLIGVGGLGCPLAQYLAAAGVGTLGLADDDVVDASNLQRQVLYGVADIGRPKLEVASERIRALNPDVEVIAHAERVTSENALEVFESYDVIVDGTDNFPRVTSATTHALYWVSQTSMAQFFASRVKPPFSMLPGALVIAASFRSLLRLALFRRALKVGCWEFCRASSQ